MTPSIVDPKAAADISGSAAGGIEAPCASGVARFPQPTALPRDAHVHSCGTDRHDTERGASVQQVALERVDQLGDPRAVTGAGRAVVQLVVPTTATCALD